LNLFLNQHANKIPRRERLGHAKNVGKRIVRGDEKSRVASIYAKIVRSMHARAVTQSAQAKNVGRMRKMHRRVDCFLLLLTMNYAVQPLLE